MSLEFTISLDKKEIKTLLNTLLALKNPTQIQNRLGQKLEFIHENMLRDEEMEDE